MKNVTLKLTLLSLIIIGLILPGFSQKLPVGTLSKQVQGLRAPRNGPAYYDQLFPPGAFTINSQAYTDPESASEINVAADDFIVSPGENWAVKYIDVLGVYSYFTGSFIEALDIRFYNNDNGVPGAEIYTALNFTQYNEIVVDADFDIYKYEITLPATVNFAPGHYWISIQAVSDYMVTDRWNWSTHGGSTIEQEFVWKNPADGFGTGFTEWTAASLLGPIWSDFNLAFALYSEGLDNDLALVSIDSPQSSSTLTASEIITVTIKNEGTGTETGFNVSYSINGGTPLVENVGSMSLAPNQSDSFSFTTTADLSQAGPYTIMASVNMTGDPRPENNQVQQTVYNYGTIYEMPESGTQTITTCGATFTDSGGLDGTYGMEDEATTTILPAITGDRVRLNFLEFDVSFGYFDIYDGTDTDAPLIGTYQGNDSPGEITALNPEGAITIFFQAPGFDQTDGWIAFISCVTPVGNDFAIHDLKSSLITVFENNTTILSAKVQNYGLQTLDKTVTFKVNNTVLGTVETGMLAPADTIRVEMPWTPTISGQYEVEVSVPADDGLDPNNSMTINPFVYPFDAFFEDFEGETFPPEGWISGGWNLNTFGGYSGSNSAEAFGPYGFSDTLQTCRIQIAAQASVSFYAASAPWWPGDMNVLWKQEGTSDWVTIYHPVISGVQYNRYEINMAGLEGQVGRLAFVAFVSDLYAWDGQILLDYILGQNVSVFFDDYDLKAVDIEGDRLYRLGETSDFVFTIKNLGLETVDGSQYRVKLMRGVENPLEVFSVPGIQIQNNEQLTFDLSYTFGYLGEYEIFAEIEFANDQLPSNNQSNILMLSGLTAQSDIVEVGEQTLTDYLPINMSYKYSLSESVYNKNDIESDGGIIFGITYDYQFVTDDPDIPVRIWMTMTDENLLYDAWIPATEMTLVYDGTLNFITGNQTIYIPFQVPFNYSDTAMNIAVMVEKRSDHTNGQQAFSTYSSGGITSRRMTSNSNPPDPDNPTSGSRIGWNPVMRLVFNHNLGTVSGTVNDPEGVPVDEASITIDPLNITVLTDASGNYELPYVPEGNYPTTAYKYTYQAVTQDLEVTFGQNTQLDFVMGQLALVTVSGHITGNDINGEPVEEALATLTGFANYTTTSDADGNFLFENVYSQNTYSLMIEADGYETYIVSVPIELSNIDLGEIILTEALIVPFQIVTSPAAVGMDIDWEHPSTNAGKVWTFDDGGYENGWAGEAGEQVWIGNLVQFEEPATITGFDMYWAKYVEYATRQPVFLDVFDADNNLIVSSNEFNSGMDEWIHISVPNITLHGDYYAMVRWDAIPEQSSFLGWDSTNIVNELARYKYPGGDFAPFSNIISKKGNMMIRPNVMTSETIPASSRILTGYNISRGKLEDIANAADWSLLNTESFSESHFNDTTWPPGENNMYVYAVKAFFTTGESEFSFSTVINYLGVNSPSLDLMQTTIYPNPASDRVFITGCADSDILIFAMDGRMISMTHANNSSTSIDVSQLASGTYLLVIKNATALKQHKLLIQ
ncbi:MAG: carboxypeptidase regulatory-like domain-containing protein [Lentimicrobium sp.]|nr:carboxypeptidase regulatory-like domain-containing protein [Lentimicrobium sp.]